MISNIRADATPALVVTREKERKTFAPPKTYLTAMIIWCKQFYYLSTLCLLDVSIKLKPWLIPKIVVSDLYYDC